MKLRDIFVCIVILSPWCVYSANHGNLLTEAERGPWRAARRLENETVWQSLSFRTNLATRKIYTYTNSYVELGTALNISERGQWVPADPSLKITETGAQALRTAHQLRVPNDIWLGGGIRVTTPKGKPQVFQP